MNAFDEFIMSDAFFPVIGVINSSIYYNNS